MNDNRKNNFRSNPRENYVKKEKEDLIFGIRAVIEAINADREINKIVIQKGIQKELFFELKEAIAGKNYFIQYVPTEKLDRLTDKNHQGVVAYLSPKEYVDFEPLVDQFVESKEKASFLFAF